MLINKRDKILAIMLEVMNANKLSGNFVIQTEWDKNIEMTDFSITCASVCVLYYKINPEWRDHIIGIQHNGDRKEDAWIWVLDDKGEKKRNKQKEKHQIKNG